MAYKKGRGNVDVFGGWNPAKWISGMQVNPKYPIVVPRNERRSYFSPRRRAEGRDIVFTKKSLESIPVVGQWVAQQAYGKSVVNEVKNTESPAYAGRTIIGPDGERKPYSYRSNGSKYRQSKYGYKKGAKGYNNGYKTSRRYGSSSKRAYSRPYYNNANRGRVQWKQNQRGYSSKQQLQF